MYLIKQMQCQILFPTTARCSKTGCYYNKLPPFLPLSLKPVHLHKAEENLVLYKELLTNDLYLRENVKKRPDFAGDYTLQKDELRYINEEILLKDERLAYFGQKNMRKFSHMEQFDHAVNEDFKETKTILFFDYQNRDPLQTRRQFIRLQ